MEDDKHYTGIFKRMSKGDAPFMFVTNGHTFRNIDGQFGVKMDDGTFRDITEDEFVNLSNWGIK